MLDYTWKLTREPHSLTSADIETLRAAGFEDVDIADINLISAYFNMLNRVATGLGVEGTPALGADSK